VNRWQARELRAMNIQVVMFAGDNQTGTLFG
jgi:hypothetical protein